MSLEFTNPHFLFFALAAVPAALVYFIGLRKAVAALEPFIAPKMRRGRESARMSLGRALAVRGGCFALAWVMLSIGAAGPRWGTKLVAHRQEGSSVVFVVDVSRSMTLDDVAPNRLSYAARYASLLTERMEKTPCGVVLAKGDAVLALPVTVDHRAVRDLLASLSPALLTSPGSSPGKGVALAIKAFPDGTAQSRTIVLFTDGDETSSSLEDSARACRAAGVTLAIVGTGSVNGASIRVYPDTDNPETRESRLREDLLTNAASLAGGRSLYVSGSETGSAFRVINAILDTENQGSRLVYSSEPVARYREFLSCALALFCSGVLVGGLSWKRK